MLTSTDQGGDDTVDSDPAGTGTTSGAVTVAVVDGETNDTIDAGFYDPVSIGDFVYYDVDADGIYTVGTDVPLVGATVTLTGTDGAANAVRSEERRRLRTPLAHTASITWLRALTR